MAVLFSDDFNRANNTYLTSPPYHSISTAGALTYNNRLWVTLSNAMAWPVAGSGLNVADLRVYLDWATRGTSGYYAYLDLISSDVASFTKNSSVNMYRATLYEHISSWTLQRYQTGVGWTSLGTVANPANVAPNRVGMERRADGTLMLSLNGSPVLTTTDLTFPTLSWARLYLPSANVQWDSLSIESVAAAPAGNPLYAYEQSRRA